MNKPKGWYNTVLEINKELELRKQGKDFHPLDLLLSEQTKILIQLFNECEFVGFPKADTKAETIVSNVLVSVQNSLTEKMDFVPDNPFFNLYLGLCYLEKVLQLVKNEYESNLNTSIEYLENIIYQSEDYKNLVEVSRSIGRNIINNKQHPDFGILKKHIAEQLEYIERNNKTVKALPPQQTETKTEQEQQTENDFTLSTIEDWLFEFKEKMNEADYKNLVSALIQYFEIGKFPTLSKPIQINGRPNKKLFGWALNRIFEAKGKGVEKELLQFAKHNISLFTDVQFDESNILKSNLYKYFTTQTK